MPVIRTADNDTFYLDEGTGEPVVFVHGHTLTHHMWDAQVAPLLAAGYRVLRYDLRGHGQSGAPLVGYTPEDLAADLKTLLDARGIAQAHVVGLSRSGGVTLAFALAYPAATRTITLIDSVLPGYPFSDAIRATLRTHAEHFAAGGKAAFLASWLTDDL
ncbi:MAG: alpha/beta fold hydrolase, partial [Dehalococcoidia bacterium]